MDSLGSRLRHADRQELEALGHEPAEALRESFSSTPGALTCTLDDLPVLMFGCSIMETEGKRVHGMVWLLSSDDLEHIARWFARVSRRWLERIAEGCDSTGNVVDSRNTVHVRWLRWLGFKFFRSIPVGDTTFLEFAKVHVHSSSSLSGHRDNRNQCPGGRSAGPEAESGELQTAEGTAGEGERALCDAGRDL